MNKKDLKNKLMDLHQIREQNDIDIIDSERELRALEHREKLVFLKEHKIGDVIDGLGDEPITIKKIKIEGTIVRNGIEIPISAER